MAVDFDDSRLDDPQALAGIDEQLRTLASAGARVRVLARAMDGARRLGGELGGRPRGVIALGAEARLVRAMLEPVCPVPFVAWPHAGLPGWVGPLDLVVVLASGGSEPALLGATGEAVRRGAALIVAAETGSPIAEAAASRSTLLLPTPDHDPLAAVVVTLEVLHQLGLGPVVEHARVAECADLVAEQCSPHADLAHNPAKELALALADAQPLVWGGSVLAARAARRIAEELRRASGRPALCADAEALLPVIEACAPADPFHDPFSDEGAAVPCVLVVVDDGADAEGVRRERGELLSRAEARGVRVCTLSAGEGTQGLQAYVELLQRGRYAAAYLALGLQRSGRQPH